MLTSLFRVYLWVRAFRAPQPAGQASAPGVPSEPAR